MNRPDDPRRGGQWQHRPRTPADDPAATQPWPARRPPAPRYTRPPGGYRPPPPPPPVTPRYQPPPPAPRAPTVTPEPTTKRPHTDRITTRWLLIGAGVALTPLAIAAVLLSGNFRFSGPGGKVLDVAKVQVGVLQTLSDPASGYGANTVTDVSCNNGRNPDAAKGTTFTCDITVNGAERQVTVVVADDHGTYEIGRPR